MLIFPGCIYLHEWLILVAVGKIYHKDPVGIYHRSPKDSGT